METFEFCKQIGINDSWANSKAFKELDYSAVLDLCRRTTILIPEKKNIFNAFTTSMFEIEAVIITSQPVMNSNGNGFGCIKGSADEVTMRTLNAFYGNLFNKTDIDETLDDIKQSKMLLLNTTLTRGFEDEDRLSSLTQGVHSIVWKKFIQNIVSDVCDANNNVAFLSMGTKAKYFTRFASRESTIIEAPSIFELAPFNNYKLAFDNFTNVLLYNDYKV